jgi:hypothetical protein
LDGFGSPHASTWTKKMGCFKLYGSHDSQSFHGSFLTFTVSLPNEIVGISRLSGTTKSVVFMEVGSGEIKTALRRRTISRVEKCGRRRRDTNSLHVPFLILSLFHSIYLSRLSRSTLMDASPFLPAPFSRDTSSKIPVRPHRARDCPGAANPTSGNCS